MPRQLKEEISLSIDNGEASPHILLKLVISKPVRRDARRLFYFCGIFPLYYHGMNVCIPSNISLRFYIRKMTQINAARNIKQRLFLFFRKNPVPLPESKTKGCPCRAEIIPYEPDTVSTGEGIVLCRKVKQRGAHVGLRSYPTNLIRLVPAKGLFLRKTLFTYLPLLKGVSLDYSLLYLYFIYCREPL